MTQQPPSLPPTEELAQLNARLERIEALLLRQDALMRQAPHALSMLVDSFDELVARQVDAGIEPSLLLSRTGDALQRFITLMQSEEFAAMMRSGVLNPETLRTIGTLSEAVRHAASRPEDRLGLLGALRASRHPDTQRAIGFVLRLAQRFGASLRRPHSPQQTLSSATSLPHTSQQ